MLFAHLTHPIFMNLLLQERCIFADRREAEFGGVAFVEEAAEGGG